MADRDRFEEQLEALETSMDGASDAVTAMSQRSAELRESATQTNREVGALSRSIGRGLRGAFDGLVFDGMRLSDALRDVGTSIVDAAYNAAVQPVQNALGRTVATGIEGFIGAAMPFAKGASFTQGRVVPFATGGIVSGPTLFPMRGGTGLMGEAGPEAIMPLTRGADGRLGVQAQGGGSVHVTMNITTPDVQGFRRSQTQIAAEMGRALGRGHRNN